LDHLYGFAHARQRPRLVEAEPVEPRARDEPEIRATARREIERCCLSGELDGVEGLDVERRRAEANVLGDARECEQRIDGRLEEEVVEDRDDVEACRLGATPEVLVFDGALVRLQPEADLERGRQVSSSVIMVRSRMRSIRMTTRSSGSGQQTSVSRSSQSSSGSRRCLAGSIGSTACSA
jgi:hypothetical protein